MIERLLKKHQERQEGFTLIELLIVIVILGVLAAIVVFAVSGITDKGQKSACASDKKTLTVAEEAYYAKTATGAAAGSYAGTQAQLVSQGVLQAPSTLFD